VHALETYDPYPIVDVHIWHDRGPLGFDFAAVLDSPLQWIFEKQPGYLACSFSAAGSSFHLATSELAALAWEETQRYVPALRDATLLRSAVTRNPEATYVPRPGAKRVGVATNVAQMTLAGSWTDTGWPDTMESAVRSGVAAARALRGAPAPAVVPATVAT